MSHGGDARIIDPTIPPEAAGDLAPPSSIAAIPSHVKAVDDDADGPSLFDSIQPEEDEIDERGDEGDEPAARQPVGWAETSREEPEEDLNAGIAVLAGLKSRSVSEDLHGRDAHATSAAPVQKISPDFSATRQRGGGVFTIPLLCIGIAIIACVSLLPLADDNHRLAWEREKLNADLSHLKEQTRVNEEFLQRVADDPTLAERLAQRQMKYIREGMSVLPLRGIGKMEMSPFHLVAVAPPPPMPEYQPLGGALATLVREPRIRLYLSGAALLLIAAGLVLGYIPKGRHLDDIADAAAGPDTANN